MSLLFTARRAAPARRAYLWRLMTSAFPIFLLNNFYEFGNKLGPILTWVFILLMVVELVYVMAKYLGGGNTTAKKEKRA